MTNLPRILAPVAAGGALALALAGCVPVPWAPVGPRVSEDRDIESVESVLLRTSGDLTITVGDEPALTITAPDGTMDRLTSEIVDGVLVLDRVGPGFGFRMGDVDYELTLPRVSEIGVDGSGDVEADFTGAEDIRIDISGSGDVEGTGIDAASVRTVIDGSGEIELSGRADEQTIEIAGSGDVIADELETTTARVEIDGSGDVAVWVTGTLRIDVSGSGDVRHHGGAEVTYA